MSEPRRDYALLVEGDEWCLFRGNEIIASTPILPEAGDEIRLEVFGDELPRAFINGKQVPWQMIFSTDWPHPTDEERT